MESANPLPEARRDSRTDTLSDVLRAVRLERAVFFDVEGLSPWVAEAPPAATVAQRLFPGAEHVVGLHVVVSGGCFGGLVDGEQVRLGPGDVIVLPQGDPHVLASAPGLRALPELRLGGRPAGPELPFSLQVGRGSVERTRVAFGFLGCHARALNPLLASLPRVLCVRAASMESGTLEPFLELALGESKARRPGSECVLARLSELLFIEALRAYISGAAEQMGWLAGLRDDMVGRALATLHGRPAHDWSLDELGKAVGSSRSVLAERFTHLVGLPPMQYLAQWRMQLAASMLRETPASLAEVAARVGYGSEAALSRAFKRVVGVAPALYRQGVRPLPPAAGSRETRSAPRRSAERLVARL